VRTAVKEQRWRVRAGGRLKDENVLILAAEDGNGKAARGREIHVALRIDGHGVDVLAAAFTEKQLAAVEIEFPGAGRRGAQ